MNDPASRSAIDRLLVELVDGKLTLDQQHRLWAILRDDPSARERYADYLLLDSHLAWEHAWNSTWGGRKERVRRGDGGLRRRK